MGTVRIQFYSTFFGIKVLGQGSLTRCVTAGRQIVSVFWLHQCILGMTLPVVQNCMSVKRTMVIVFKTLTHYREM